MFRNDRVFIYKLIAIACTIVLCLVQLLHINNIYKLEEEVYSIEEKGIIKKEYEESIVNDKVFPGAVVLIDTIIYKYLPTLEALAIGKNDSGFKRLSAMVCDTLFKVLRANNNMDRFLDSIKKKHKISATINYALFVEQIDIAIEPNRYYNLFNKSTTEDDGHFPYEQNTGAQIGGSLKCHNQQTLASWVKVSAPAPHSYRMDFALYCDRPDRLQTLIIRTLPKTLVSVFSIIAVLVIFFLTFANWIRQKKMSEMKTDFINTITHEFQTPLTAIVIANKTMEHENSSLKNEKLSSLNTIIKRQTERLSVLITQVTDTSCEKPIQLALAGTSVNGLLEDIIADYQLNILDTNTIVTLDKRAQQDQVMLDKLHFTSIILNVINNGIKYNQKDSKKILVTTSNKSGDTLVISILDNGDGMSNQVKKRMFSRFYRNPSLTNSQEPGLGLGLYYTKQCLDAHNWKYEVKSKVGAGTEFIVYIPLFTASGSAAQPETGGILSLS
ncbi:MAG: HAMP domain-containing sensor histidine kinase [Chitinophagaceae bacterium]